ncbi:leucine-rich repeat domain-containing protein [Bremerella sp.]|uniref:leucine-rich repeat domain-containing protein n=1 Tax=Bremerella sp. TaxID=2795602 RepID=UPI00391A85F6
MMNETNIMSTGITFDRILGKASGPHFGVSAGLTLMFILVLANLVGCGEPTDMERFDQAIHAIQEGRSDQLDMRGHTNIPKEEFARMAGLERLRWLRLDGCQFSDTDLDYLLALPALETIYLSDTQITNAGLERIGKIQSLKSLTLDKTPVDSTGLGHLSNLSNLENLSLWKCFITDDGCKSLSGLSQLKKLSLDGTQVTDAGMKHLTSLKNLERISLWQTRVTDKGVATLQKELPTLVINR